MSTIQFICLYLFVGLVFATILWVKRRGFHKSNIVDITAFIFVNLFYPTLPPWWVFCFIRHLYWRQGMRSRTKSILHNFTVMREWAERLPASNGKDSLIVELDEIVKAMETAWDKKKTLREIKDIADRSTAILKKFRDIVDDMDISLLCSEKAK